MKKNMPAFPNKCFSSQEDYFDFSDRYHLFGNAAYEKKREMLKKARIPLPKIK